MCIRSLSRIGIGLFVAIALAQSASARVFQFSEHTVGAYVHGTLGNTLLGQSAFGYSSGNRTYFDAQVSRTIGGEVGIILLTKHINFRLGVEVLGPQKMESITGYDRNNNNQLMTLSSQIIGVVPSLHLEFVLKETPHLRFMLIGGAGYGTVTVLNSYTFTTAGQAVYPGMPSFTEEVTGSSITGDGGLALELLSSDSSTIVLDAGYRYFYVDGLTHNRDAKNFQGTVTKGQSATFDNGKNRNIELSGAWVGLGLRFYF